MSTPLFAPPPPPYPPPPSNHAGKKPTPKPKSPQTPRVPPPTQPPPPPPVSLNTFVLGLIQQFDPRASQASKAADLALLSSIERRIDAEFKGGADQLLQLRVTVGNAYRERGQLAAARRVYRRAIVEAETTLPANDVGLLKARVARAWFAIADDEALQSIDTTIELLRQSGPAGIEPLIDALLARVDSAGVIGRRPGMTWDLRYADAREAYDLAVRHFGAGGAQQLRAAQGLT